MRDGENFIDPDRSDRVSQGKRFPTPGQVNSTLLHFFLLYHDKFGHPNRWYRLRC